MKAIWIGVTVAAAIASLTPAKPSNSAETPSGAYAELPGVRLWYTDTGGPGDPIVLLHANTGTSASWAKQVTAFANAGYRVIAFDRRGWGRSKAEPSTGPQPGSVAGDLDELTAHLNLGRINLVGVAGGGFVALDFAAWRPEKVRRLVVAASTGLVTEPEIDGFVRNELMYGVDTLPEVLRELSAGYRGSNPAGTAEWIAIEEHAKQPGAASQPLRTPNTYSKLETIAAPTLVLAADADLLAPPAIMRMWAGHVKRAEWAAIAEAGHSVAWEQPEAFNQLVLSFIKRP